MLNNADRVGVPQDQVRRVAELAAHHVEVEAAVTLATYVYMYIHICIHVYIHICVYIYRERETNINMYIYIYICIERERDIIIILISRIMILTPRNHLLVWNVKSSGCHCTGTHPWNCWCEIRTLRTSTSTVLEGRPVS